MARTVDTDYDAPIMVGTHLDDRRLNRNVLYIQTTSNVLTRRVLTRDQTYELLAALLETLREIENRD